MSVVDLGGVDPGVWRGLLGQANAGELTLDRDVGNALNIACENYLLKLDGIFTKTLDVREVEGFGGFESSAALQTKFTEKATGTTQSIDAVIREHIETVKLIQQVVAKSIANLEATDDGTGQKVTKTGQDLPQG
ncbi:hypothetical protein ACFXNW_03990 [Nocardia sp. NPDC059180]|uniref:hypothetical protein n=1 Tax=Nocardia sp. NPDC059180 TaxID=3346761 RepID=UPI0036AAC109